ncbi:MAG: Mrp/NBP35 family ATP-binding protein [Armatimonadota bacterium]|nr:Mrp/NBP35 family ATP-binding protein [Armatimonadota bacterium]MDR7445191.1 Mrp/NBP35 family ATP-binding protein [Armatimonadota bacterium]MDR7571100.1 Mrp/NBP35 family ATP-binding protein [Armatimonadota bacterium]MDR7613708.1 Mrp/NBP35 family ATP-binding protein [Armatimonadota bacterium]
MELKDQVWEVLRGVRYPGYTRDIVSFGLVRRVTAQRDVVGVALAVAHLAPEVQEALEREVRRAVLGLPGVRVVEVVRVAPAGGRQNAPRSSPEVPLARRAVAVASGKGGVGKSTVTTNLAAALALEGLRVGVLDADVYGFSIARMLGVTDRPEVRGGRIVPIQRRGIQVVTMGMLVDAGEAVIWRGPMLHKALRTFLHEVAWEDLDVLLLDLPPGTGDVALTIAQELLYAEWLVVTTPQPAAVEVALRAARMAEKVNLRVLGVVENLSWYRPLPDGPVVHPFGRGGGREAAQRLGVPLLAELPLDPAVRECADRGEPVVWARPELEVSAVFRDLARRVRPQEVRVSTVHA